MWVIIIYFKEKYILISKWWHFCLVKHFVNQGKIYYIIAHFDLNNLFISKIFTLILVISLFIYLLMFLYIESLDNFDYGSCLNITQIHIKIRYNLYFNKMENCNLKKLALVTLSWILYMKIINLFITLIIIAVAKIKNYWLPKTSWLNSAKTYSNKHLNWRWFTKCYKLFHVK